MIYKESWFLVRSSAPNIESHWLWIPSLGGTLNCICKSNRKRHALWALPSNCTRPKRDGKFCAPTFRRLQKRLASSQLAKSGSHSRKFGGWFLLVVIFSIFMAFVFRQYCKEVESPVSKSTFVKTAQALKLSVDDLIKV